MVAPDPHSGPSSHQIHHHHHDDPADKIVILYASETGNAQDTAERVGREVRRRGRRCTITSMDLFDVFQLPDTPLLILITSTHGRGDPPPAMLPLWNALLRSSLPEDILEDVNFALFGLGDSSYERFCYAGKMLMRRLEGLGAQPLTEPAWGDERAPNGIEDAFLPWLQQTMDMMLPHLPTEPGHIDYSQTDIPPRLYDLQPCVDLKLGALRLNGHTNGDIRSHEGVNGKADSRGWKPKDWVWGRMTAKQRVTPEDWWQDVRQIDLEFEGQRNQYEPGSICCLQPQTTAEEVEDFLELSGLSSQADDPVTIRSRLRDQPLPQHLPSDGVVTTLRSILTNHLDLRCSPRKSFFEWLRRFSTVEREQERLDEFIADPVSLLEQEGSQLMPKDEIHTYATRPSRSILETMADFRETRIPLSHLLEVLPPLRRRQFSIASSSEAHPGKVQLLIALVKYKTNLKIPRRGLCSSWLESLPQGARVALSINPPTLFLPASSGTPVVLVGPGTGVAPMRAFLEYRIRQGAAQNTMLYFGCRSASADLYFAEEWEEYRSKGATIRVAASRDQEDKLYVQHLMREDAAKINDWLVTRRGHVYISGSSNAMPREVRAAIAWCISTDGAGAFTTEEAEKFVEDMFESGRGGEESW